MLLALEQPVFFMEHYGERGESEYLLKYSLIKSLLLLLAFRPKTRSRKSSILHPFWEKLIYVLLLM